MPTLKPRIAIKSTGVTSTSPVEFMLSQPVNDELIDKIQKVDGISHAWNDYRYAVEVRVARLFDLQAVAEAVAREIITHFEWEPDVVRVNLDGEPLDLS